tara:strand:+ start:1014 stop:1205 length:192 start_codon:yes stop_codon:yes gene_type:complete
MPVTKNPKTPRTARKIKEIQEMRDVVIAKIGEPDIPVLRRILLQVVMGTLDWVLNDSADLDLK